MSIQCPGCKAYLAISNPLECPRCHATLAQPAARPKGAAMGMAGSSSHVAGIVIGSAVVLFFGFLFFRMAVPSEEQIRKERVARALLACQKSLVGQALFGNAEMPPPVANYGSGDEFYFTWPIGSFYFKNGFGASIKMSASCIGDISTGKIRQLTLNGKDVL